MFRVEDSEVSHVGVNVKEAVQLVNKLLDYQGVLG